MNNIKFLLLGTSLSFIPLTVNAQCVATQDCATLGYTETSCNGGEGVKCPFGNKWACLGVNEEECKQKFCDEYGFTLTCTGTGYAGGAGSACGGKYVQCTCASGYEWKDGACKQKMTDGAHGDLYYCNGKVVGVKTGDMDFYVAINDIGTMSWHSAKSSCKNYDFCSNVKGILPDYDQLEIIYENKSLLNSFLSTNGGADLSDGYYWSSTCNDYNCSYYGYVVDMSSGPVGSFNRDSLFYVRPVLENY